MEITSHCQTLVLVSFLDISNVNFAIFALVKHRDPLFTMCMVGAYWYPYWLHVYHISCRRTIQGVSKNDTLQSVIFSSILKIQQNLIIITQ